LGLGCEPFDSGSVVDLVSGAHLVKAFNHLRADVLASDPRLLTAFAMLVFVGISDKAIAQGPPGPGDKIYDFPPRYGAFPRGTRGFYLKKMGNMPAEWSCQHQMLGLSKL